MHSNAQTPQEYLLELPPDRRGILTRLRAEVLANLPAGLEETMIYGMIGYVVPHSLYPKGYHVDPKLPVTMFAIASQKNHIALYHMGVYSLPGLREWFEAAYVRAVGKKPDMGKSCLRIKPTADIPYGLIGELCGKVTVGQYLALYEQELKK